MVAWTRQVRREDLLRDGYIAEQSRHNLGLAVDLTLVDLATGRELKMGTGFDTFGPAANTANARGAIAANRQRLVRAMDAVNVRCGYTAPVRAKTAPWALLAWYLGQIDPVADHPDFAGPARPSTVAPVGAATP